MLPQASKNNNWAGDLKLIEVIIGENLNIKHWAEKQRNHIVYPVESKGV